MIPALFNEKIINARKWSSFAEIVSKVIVPITNMILARLISPTAFGIVTTATMIFSFGDIFSTGGFPNYIIQKRFFDSQDESKAIDIAFTSNLFISVLIWILIIVFQEQIANLVGLQGYSATIVVSCFQLILTAFSSIQLAVLKKRLEFKKLFKIRFITSIIPLIISIPLAYIGFSYWAIIYANLFKELVTIIYLKFNSDIKLKPYFDFNYFMEMFSFCIWSLTESIVIWLCIWIDSIIIGSLFSQYEVGMWKTTSTMITGLFGIIRSITIPVLFSSLCILQNDIEEYNHQIHLTRKIIGLIVFPMSIGIIFFNQLAVYITLGSQWEGAEIIFICKSLLLPFVYTIAHIASEIYRSKGDPKVSAIVQFVYIIIFIPLAIFFAKLGFNYYVKLYPLFDLIFVAIHLICLKVRYSYSIVDIFKDLVAPIIFSFIMMFVIYLFKFVIGFSVLDQFILIGIGMCTYFTLIYLNENTRKVIIEFFFYKNKNREV